MASSTEARPCNIVLHDDRISSYDVLGGADVLPTGSFAYLSTENIADVLILARAKAPGPKDVSVHIRLGTRFGFANRTAGKLSYVRDTSQTIASHVDILLRDQILSRADLWHLTTQLDEQIVYRSSDLHYLGNASASIQHIYQSGQAVSSALCRGGLTKSILRSANARFVVLIQVSSEMLEDWTNGHLMFEMLTQGFLQDLFERWESEKVRHLVSIVLFGRVDGEGRRDGQDGDVTDFFLTLHLDAPCSTWRELLISIKRAFNAPELPRSCSRAESGNILEAINLTAAHFLASAESIYLSGTGSAMIVVTAGAGLFNVDYNLLNTTTRVLLGHSIGIDIISLAAKPMHPVPLFLYKLDDKYEYALPHWADISFYLPSDIDQAAPANRSVTEEDRFQDIEIPFLAEPSAFLGPSALTYDEDVFSHSSGTLDTRNGLMLEASKLDTERNVAATKPAVAPKLRQHPSASSIATTVSLSRQSKNKALSLLSNRKISVGPRGLAPITSVASTTVSVAHAKHDRDLPQNARHMPIEHESGIAKQIRASLRRRPSQSSLASWPADEEMPTQAITIRPSQATVGSTDKIATNMSTSASSQLSHSTSRDGKLSSFKKLHAFGNMASSPAKPSLDPRITAFTPWLTLLNPCNLSKDNMRIAAQYRQWQHVFPKAIDSAEFKWKSICTPAALPLYHDLLPSTDDLTKYYKRATRRLICGQPGGSGQRAQELLQRLIALRLAHGFQLITFQGHSKDSHVFMSIGTDYHELQYLSDLELEVIEYTYRPFPPPQHLPLNPIYRAEVKSHHSEEPVIATTLFADIPPEIDWAALDQEMGSDRAPSSLSRMRLILLPDRFSDHGAEDLKELADDERRIEGIRRLTQQWQRHRVLSTEDQSHLVSFARNTQSRGDGFDANPLAIEYHTRDPSALVNAQESILSSNNDSTTQVIPLFTESEMYHSSNFDITRLVRQMQAPPPHGVEVRDRRWFARIHLKCFRGDEMTNWLLGAFKDLHSREDAVELGNELMERGVFSHVRHRHNFLDGNYFYQIAPAHRTTEYPNAIASVFNRGSARSAAHTPSSEVRMSPQVRPSRGESESSGHDGDHVLLTEKQQVMLSQSLCYNVDPFRKSAYSELVNLHYDRIHNPENCYHIYLDWCLTTPKLIRDTINRWANLVEGCGLRLVQVPLLEASKHSVLHPFQQPLYVKLSQEPPDRVPATPLLNTLGGSPRVVEDGTFFHRAILRRLGFVLDLESTDSFSSRLDVMVSWGKMDFSMTQFVHHSGLVLAQISKGRQGDFLLLPNTLAAERGHAVGRNHAPETVASVMESVQELAKDSKALKALYDDMAKPRLPAPSPFAKAVMANADADVPPMQLPPHLLHRVFS